MPVRHHNTPIWTCSPKAHPVVAVIGGEGGGGEVLLPRVSHRRATPHRSSCRLDRNREPVICLLAQWFRGGGFGASTPHKQLRAGLLRVAEHSAPPQELHGEVQNCGAVHVTGASEWVHQRLRPAAAGAWLLLLGYWCSHTSNGRAERLTRIGRDEPAAGAALAVGQLCTCHEEKMWP